MRLHGRIWSRKVNCLKLSECEILLPILADKVQLNYSTCYLEQESVCVVREREMGRESMEVVKLAVIDLSSTDRLGTAKSIHQVSSPFLIFLVPF